MAEAEKLALEIVGVYFEVDRTRRSRHWLWLKVRSDAQTPVEVRVRHIRDICGNLPEDHPMGCKVNGLSLGFHALNAGLNELPPLPLKTECEWKKPTIFNIRIKSIRDPLLFDEVSQNAFFTPYLIIGGKGQNNDLFS